MATFHRKLSRREFLKMSGLAASGVALAACTKGESAPSATPVKKTLVLAIQSFAHDAMRPVLDAWTQKTGLQVELVGGPATGEEMIARYAEENREELEREVDRAVNAFIMSVVSQEG